MLFFTFPSLTIQPKNLSPPLLHTPVTQQGIALAHAKVWSFASCTTCKFYHGYYTCLRYGVKREMYMYIHYENVWGSVCTHVPFNLIFIISIIHWININCIILILIFIIFMLSFKILYWLITQYSLQILFQQLRRMLIAHFGWAFNDFRRIIWVLPTQILPVIMLLVYVAIFLKDCMYAFWWSCKSSKEGMPLPASTCIKCFKFVSWGCKLLQIVGFHFYFFVN